MKRQKTASKEPARTGDKLTTSWQPTIYDSEHLSSHSVIAGMIDQLVYNILNQGQLHCHDCAIGQPMRNQVRLGEQIYSNVLLASQLASTRSQQLTHLIYIVPAPRHWPYCDLHIHAHTCTPLLSSQQRTTLVLATHHGNPAPDAWINRHVSEGPTTD